MIKTALVGLGWFGSGYHLPNILSHKGFSLAAVVDTNTERLEKVMNAHGVPGYTDIRVMLEKVKPGLTVIATPTHLHAEHAIISMRLGSDVFLEKPMAKDLKEAEKIVSVVKETGRKLMVFQPRRTSAETAVMKKILSMGILGKVYMIKCAISDFFIRKNWQAYKEFGGGTLNNHGAHTVDLLLHLSGGKAESVCCNRYRAATVGDADDVAKIVIRTDNGITLDIDMNFVTAFKLIPWMIFGRYGTAIHTLNEEGKPVFRVKYYREEDMTGEKSFPWKTRDFEISKEDEISFYDKCYEYFALNMEPFVPLKETLYVMEILDRCRSDSGWD